MPRPTPRAPPRDLAESSGLTSASPRTAKAIPNRMAFCVGVHTGKVVSGEKPITTHRSLLTTHHSLLHKLPELLLGKRSVLIAVLRDEPLRCHGGLLAPFVPKANDTAWGIALASAGRAAKVALSRERKATSASF